GTEFTVSFASHPDVTRVESAVSGMNLDATVISTGAGGYIIRTPPLSPAAQKNVEDGLQKALGPMQLQQVLEVGGTIAKETTAVGFPVPDTIVVFDRIRQNLRVSERLSFDQVVNLSIMQTAARSIITSFTVVLVLAAILIAGGATLKGFALALLIGIVSGTYSSIFNAAPLLVVWRRLQPVR